MKNTVFTVIAVLLLLATAQFAAGIYTEDKQYSTDITIYNDYEDTSILVAQAEIVTLGTESWRVHGWWWIRPGKSAHFTRLDNWGPMYFHIKARDSEWTTIGQTDSGHPIYKDTIRLREVIPEFGRAFYERGGGHQSDTYPDSASFYTVWLDKDEWYRGERPSDKAHIHYDNHSPRDFIIHYGGNSFQEIEETGLDFTFDIDNPYADFVWMDMDKWKSEGILRRDPRQRPEFGEFYPAFWTNEYLDQLRVEHATFWRYSLGTSIRVGGTTPVMIDGLSRSEGWTVGTGNTLIPEVGGNKFIILQQYGNTCGPTSLEMVLHYYGKEETMEDIWRAGDIDTVKYGTWPGEMRQALNELDVPAHLYDEDTDGYRNDPFERLRRYVDGNRPPCILIRYSDLNGEVRYHWVVVVGYHYDSDAGIDAYLIADPHGHFRWESRSRLNRDWSFEGGNPFGYWRGGFNPFLENHWTHAAIDLFTNPYTAIVPRSAPTKHPKNYWTEYGDNGETDEERLGPKGYYKVKGEAKVAAGVINFLTFGLVGKKATRSWSETIEFDYKFDRYTVSAIKLFSWGGTATLSGHEKDGDRGVKIWGKIEDGAVVRGELDVMVRTYRSERSPAAPSKVTLTRLPEPAAATALLPNYPNPFNPETWIPYQLSKPADVAVSIYAIDGRLVRRLDLGQMPSGVYRSRARAAYWDGRNATGEPVASGIYFYTLQAGDFISTRKMVIRK